jgi:hypothetical protein
MVQVQEGVTFITCQHFVGIPRFENSMLNKEGTRV